MVVDGVILLYTMAAVFVSLAALCIVMQMRSTGYGDGWGMAAIVVGIWALISTVFAIAAPTTRAIEKSNCYSWAEQTGREAKFRGYGVGGLEWDCFVRTADGTWLPKSQLRDVAP